MRRLRAGFQLFSTWHAVLLALLVLMGCQRTVYLPIQDEAYKLPSRVDRTSDARVTAMRNAFDRAGVVKVMTLGQDYLISLPSSAIFADQSPRVKWESYALLNQVVCFMKEFRKVGVNVTSYSSQYVSSKREQALTLARAREVGDYLWSQGIDSRLIVTEGAGSDKPITSYQGGDNTPNSRIEITFRDAIV